MTGHSELALCPFCGHGAKHHERHNPMSRWPHSIDCCHSECGMSGPVAASQTEAIALWNQRASLSPDPRPGAGDASGVEALRTAERINATAKRSKTDGRVFIDYRDWEAFMAEVRAALSASPAATRGEPVLLDGGWRTKHDDLLRANGILVSQLRECQAHHRAAVPAPAPADGEVALEAYVHACLDYAAAQRGDLRYGPSAESVTKLRAITLAALATPPAARSEPAAEMGWQPMSTAPKDETWFVALEGGETYPCSWIAEDDEDDEGPCRREGWYDHFNQSFENPEKWAPVATPEAPGAQEETL